MIAKCNMAVVVVGAALLAGCTPPVFYQPPPQPVFYDPAPYPAPYVARPAPFNYAPARRIARASPSPPAPHIENAPLRELTPEESGASGPSWFSSWLSSPSNADCVGYWRICHFTN